MAPEQAGAHAFDARVDVYSLGVLIFEMTTGRLPFEAPTLQALLVALATQAPRSIRYYAPELPIELDDLVLRFIARDPRVRPKSAAAALAEIITLEERLAMKTLPALGSSQQSSSGVSVRIKREIAVDGLPGKLEGAFANELHSHLDELRRTGSMFTSSVDEPIPETELPEPSQSPDTGPISSGADRTRPMDRREISDLMAAPSSDSLKVAPRAAGRPAQQTPRSEPPPKPSARKIPVDEEIEEDSGVFYGRMDASGKPTAIRLDNARHSATVPPAKPRTGPPPIVIWIAFAAFVIVAALVMIRVLR
jgi:serine/threonine protein kinase